MARASLLRGTGVADRPKRFRVTGVDENGDVHAFETNDRLRAKHKLEEFKTVLKEAQSETQRWV